MEYGNYFKDAFQKLSLLEQDFDISVDAGKTDELATFIADDREAIPEEPVFDTAAEKEDELQDNYVGKVIIECECCHSKFYKEPEDVIIDSETQLANIDEECPFCNATMGYTVIGKIEPFDEEEPTEDEVEIEVDDEVVEPEEPAEDEVDEVPEEEVEDEEEEVEESFNVGKFRKQLNEKRKACKDDDCKVVSEFLDDEKKEEPLEECGDKLTEGVSYDAQRFAEWYDNCRDWDTIDKIEKVMQKYPDRYDEDVDVTFDKLPRKVQAQLLRIAGINESLTEDVMNPKTDEVFATLDKALKRPRPVMIIGGPGTGKTSMVKKWAKDRGVNLKMLTGSGIEPEEHLPDGAVLIDEYDRAPYEVKATLLNEIKRKAANGDLVIAIVNKKPEAAEMSRFFVVNVGDTNYRAMNTAKEDESLTEDFKDVSITTDDQHLEMTSDESGKVTVTTEPLMEDSITDEPLDSEGGQEEIAPLSDEDVSEIVAQSEEAADEENEDEEIATEDELDFEEPEAEEEGEEDEFDEFDEESFDQMGESYMRKVYDNIKSYKTTAVTESGNTLIVEGLITFTSGNTKKTTYTFSNPKMMKGDKVVLEGFNKTFSKTKKAFSLKGKIDNKKFITESLGYNYITKKLNESVRVTGRVKRVLV